MKKILTLLIASLIFLLPFSVFAAEAPDLTGLEPEAANVLIEQYNQELKEEYEAEVAQIEAANAEEIAKQEQSEKEVVAAEAEIEKFEAKALENNTTESADLPTDWESEATETPKTIQIVDGSAEETVKFLNIHLFLDEEFESDGYGAVTDINDENFTYNTDLLDHMVVGEWELVETPTDAFVTTISESEAMGYRSSAFYKKLPGYTNGYWLPLWAENYATAAWSYETWYKGSAHEISYIDGTTDRRDPTNVLNIYTYQFRRQSAEPELYEAQLQELPQEPTYMEPVEIKEPEVEPTPTPTPIPEPQPTPQPEPTRAENLVVVTEEPTPTPIVEEPIEEEKEEIIIVEEEIPMAAALEKEYWAVMNLVLSIIALLFIIPRTYKKNLLAKVLIIALSALVFVFTEDWALPMRWFDRWTLVHFGLTWVQVLLCRKQEESEEDEESVD